MSTSEDHAGSRRVLLLGVGNTLLTDDGVGVHAVRTVRDAAEADGIVVREAEVAGFALLDILAGFDAAVVVDAIRVAGLTPGEMILLDGDDLPPSLHLVAGHQVDLPTALALGREVGVPMPEEVRVLGIQIEDDRTFGTQPTPAVSAAVDEVALAALSLARELTFGSQKVS